MKVMVYGLLGAILLVSSQANAGHRHHQHRNAAVYYDHGRVLKVKPVYGQVSQLSSGGQCYGQHRHNKVNRQRNGNNVLPTVTGAVVGGVVGNALGNRRNKTVTTAAGAIIGGAIGYEVGQNRNSHRVHHNNNSYCVNTQENAARHRGNRGNRITGYLVTYRYKGEKFTTYTHEHPGRRIPLEVSVRPARYR